MEIHCTFYFCSLCFYFWKVSTSRQCTFPNDNPSVSGETSDDFLNPSYGVAFEISFIIASIGNSCDFPINNIAPTCNNSDCNAPTGSIPVCDSACFFEPPGSISSDSSTNGYTSSVDTGEFSSVIDTSKFSSNIDSGQGSICCGGSGWNS